MDYLISNEILEDPDVTGKELIVYCVLQSLFYSTDYDTVLFNYGSIHYALTGKTQMKPFERAEYLAILKSLYDKGYVSIEPLTQGRYILDIRYFDVQEDQYFTHVDIKNIIKLYKLYKAKSYSLCKQYLYILRTIGSRHYFGISEWDINWHTGFSAPTIGENNAILNKLGLLYIVFTTNQNYTNTYGIPEYKDEIDAATKKHGITANSNKRRSISIRYSRLKAFGTMKLEDAKCLLADMKAEIADHPDLVSDKWDINIVQDYITKHTPTFSNIIEEDEDNTVTEEHDEISDLFA